MLLRLIQSIFGLNPLVGLTASAVRLYGALEVFKTAHTAESIDYRDDHEWFCAPQRDERLQATGFSKTEIDKGLDELVKAGVLEIRNKRRTLWYLLK